MPLAVFLPFLLPDILLELVGAWEGIFVADIGQSGMFETGYQV